MEIEIKRYKLLMNTFVSKNLSNHEESKIWCSKLDVSWSFKFCDFDLKIPSFIYYENGFIIDIICVNYTDDDEVLKKKRKSLCSCSSDKHKITSNIIFNILVERIELNGKCLNGNRTLSIKDFTAGSIYNDPVFDSFFNLYNLKPKDDMRISCMRLWVELKSMLDVKLNSLALVLKQNAYIAINKHFNLTIEKPMRLNINEFIHPITQQKHTVSIEGMEVFSIDVNKGLKLSNSSYRNYISINYKIVPELANARLIMSSSSEENQKITTNNMKGVIGGERGLAVMSNNSKKKWRKTQEYVIIPIEESISKGVDIILEGVFIRNIIVQKECFNFH